MTYHYREGVTIENKKKKWLLVLPVFFLIGGGYMLLNVLAPSVPVLDNKPSDATAQKLVKKEPGAEGNRLYIPQINVDVAIVEGDSELSLEKGTWHRNPQNGNPEKGGNFVLSAHRFQLGMTPTDTRAKSPFYHIDKVEVGDEIFVDYGGKRYVYQVSKTYKVDRTAVEIEAPSDEDKLTLYSCELRGEKAGREVVEAKPAGVVAWSPGSPWIDRSQTN